MRRESSRFDAQAGARLDLFLCDRLSVSRSQARSLLALGKVSVAGRIAGESDKGLILDAGQSVRVEPFETGRVARAVPQPEMPLTILAQGDGYVVVDKPASMAVHPLREGERDTLLNALVARYPQVQGVGEGGLRSGVVHRLDLQTSGVLVVATTQDRWERLRRAFGEHRTTKIYRAIVLGQLDGAGDVRLPLIVTQHKPAKVRVARPGDPDARWCDLTWHSLASNPIASLVEINLGTGFLHQVRVTMAHLGHALVGDPLYHPAGTPDPSRAPRVMLHASRLHVDDIEAHSPDPADFAQCLTQLRLSTPRVPIRGD